MAGFDMSELKQHLLETIDYIKRERIAVLDFDARATISELIKAAFLDAAVEINDEIEGVLEGIALTVGKPESPGKPHGARPEISDPVEMCDRQLKQSLAEYL
jgi:hypothetical protein